MKKAAIIGVGTMGSAIKTCLNGKYEVIAIDVEDDITQAQTADYIILAVKPQLFEEVSKNLKQFVGEQLVISIMAGVKISKISEKLASNKVVRTMPNLGIQNKNSFTAAFCSDSEIRKLSVEVIEAWGEVVWLDQEEDFDFFTAVAGCGPAYFYEMTNQLAMACREYGFSIQLASKIATSTLKSAASAIGNEDPADKVRQVASTGGVTESGLKKLAEGGFNELMQDTINAAKNRSEELSQ